jgi:NAD(P)-dependent dehydrogenase (short-subunit alcohol dehydrogenase family)
MPTIVSKHAVVSLSETLLPGFCAWSPTTSASVLVCPYFVPTGISQSHRNRPGLNTQKPTHSQLQAMTDSNVGRQGHGAGRASVFDAGR